MNKLEVSHFILLLQIYSHDKIERSISAIDHLIPSVLNEGAQ